MLAGMEIMAMGKGREGLCVKEEAQELLRPYITGSLLRESRALTRQCNILCKHDVLGTEGARQHDPRQIPTAG